ncbi:hypothetical protein DPMN_080380 [Dreissena polymorpha]|uniref:Uncharacterized protein n=1 Tax=Dreissena polymorpha TaxID=45954 RepID=A0A9D3YRA0_DREPO|nr:hypothetical protein DPMN_080380 [Dreissena polymorpha]
MRAGRAVYNVPAQFRETSAEYLGHFRAPRSPPAPIMRPCPTHFTMPSNQPVASGVSLPSNQPVVSGVSLYNNQPVASGVSLLNNQPVVSGFPMPNNPTVVSSVPVQSTLPVVGYLIAASNLPILGNTIAPNNPTVALPNSIPVPIGHPVQIKPPTQRDRDVLTKLPKSLLFDGCSNWLMFKRKFERYARVQDWSDEECGDCLCWCLTGKAVDFYALLTEGRETLPYRAYAAASGALWCQGAHSHRAGSFPGCPTRSRRVPGRLVRSGADAGNNGIS